MDEIDIYDTTEQKDYAAVPAANHTLAVLYGADSGRVNDVLQETATLGPAYVAAERAKLVRKDNLELLKSATLELAKTNNAPAVEQGFKAIAEAESFKEQSFYDDVQDSAEEALERYSITMGVPKDEVVRRAQLYKDNLATRTALEVATSSLEGRGDVAQLAMGITGVQSVADAGRLTPILNEEFEKVGFKGSRAFSFQSGVNNFLETLNIIAPNDRPKVINTLVKRLVPVVGEANTKRLFDAAINGYTSSTTADALFTSLDLLTLGSLLNGATRAVLNSTKTITLARKVGAEDAAVKNIADKLTSGTSTLNVSTKDAVEGSMSVKTLLSKELDGTSSGVQENLRARLESTIKDLDAALYSGGAKPEEVMATKARLEQIYSRENNAAIVTSKVSAFPEKGKLAIDVTYGDSAGRPFATAEEALAYYKDIKRGDLEVVPVAGKADEIAATTSALDTRIAELNNKVQEAQYAPRVSTAGKVSDIEKQLPLLTMPERGYLNESSIPGVFPRKAYSVEQAWGSVRATASQTEQFVIDRIIKVLPKETRVIVTKGEGTSQYNPGTDTLIMYGGNKDTRIFSHELIHAVTSHKIKYGRENPSSELGKITRRMDDLRAAVIKEIPKINKKETDLIENLTYLTKNTEEFATAGLWSLNQLPKVAIFLQNIKYKNTTLLSELWAAFKNLLGFGDKDTALSEWFGLNEEMTKQGLRVTLPKEIDLGGMRGQGTVLSMLDTQRVIKPYLPNAELDDTLSALESAVASRVLADVEKETASMGYYLRQKADMPVYTADIGKISQSELDQMHLSLGRINPRLSSVNSIYSPALLSMYKQTKYGKLQSDFIKESFDKLDAKQIDVVNSALVQTETLKRDMSLAELGAAGVRTDSEVEAYYAFRTMRNVEYYLKNKEAANAFVSKGYVNVFVGMGDDGVFTGPAKSKSIQEIAGKKVYDVENKTYVTVTDDVAKELSARGLQIFEYAKAQAIEGRKGSITRVAVPPNQVKVGDVTSVVGRVDGAYSRVYTEEYFIKIKGQQLIDEDMQDVSYAFRTAVSEKDAAAYMKGFNELLDLRNSGSIIEADDVSRALTSYETKADELAQRINTGEFDGSKAVFNYTRLEDNFFRDVTGVGASDLSGGRVFWSGRTESGIKSITSGSTKLETLGPLQSLEAEMSNTARFTALNEWRRNSVERWFNTFDDVISDIDKANAKSAEEVFFNVVNNVSGYALSDSKAKQMLATKDFILTQLGVKSVDEQLIQHAINTLTNNINVPGFSHVGQWLRKTDLINWAKSTNSTLMLGLFSPAQLIVQSSGMLLAASISPKHGLKAAFSIRPILTAMTSDNPSVWKFIFKNAGDAKKMGMEYNEFKEVAEAIKRVGLLDNIGASSLYNGADGALNVFSRRTEKFNQAQMMFFNKGEEISRVGAFDIARREFIEANPGVLWNTDSALQSIVQRADDLTMNMTRVNDARVTKGILGIPLQFLQHNIRLGTNLIAQVGAVSGKKAPTLTTADAARLTLGSYLLYGISNNATPDFIEEWLGDELNDTLSEQQKQYLTQGVLAGILSTIGETITGERTNIALGSRLSSIQWYEDLGKAVFDLFKGEKVDVKKLAGPTGSTLTALLELPEIFLDYRHKDEWTLSEFATTLSSAGATLASSWRNVDKAYWAYHANGMVLSKRGDPLANLSWTELIAQGLGFQSTQAYESGTVFSTKQSYNKTMQNYADSVMRLEGLARKAYLNNDVAGMHDNYAAAEAVMAPLPESDRQFIKRLIKDTTSYDVVGTEAFTKWATQMSSHKNRLLVTSPFGE
jgi:hypothetical protein